MVNSDAPKALPVASDEFDDSKASSRPAAPDGDRSRQGDIEARHITTKATGQLTFAASQDAQQVDKTPKVTGKDVALIKPQEVAPLPSSNQRSPQRHENAEAGTSVAKGKATSHHPSLGRSTRGFAIPDSPIAGSIASGLTWHSGLIQPLNAYGDVALSGSQPNMANWYLGAQYSPAQGSPVRIVQHPGQPPFPIQYPGQPSFSPSPTYGHSIYGAPGRCGIPGRRPNPKLLLARRNKGRASGPPSPQPIDRRTPGAPKDINYEVVAIDEGVGELFGLCKVVPYLIGPKHLLENLITLRDHVKDFSEEAFQADDGKSVVDPKVISFMDKAIMFVLWLLQKPGDDKAEPISKLLDRFDTENDKLVVWKNHGENGPPERAAIALFDFADMAIDWKRAGNPCYIAVDRSDCVTPWEAIIPYMRKRNIKMKYIEKAEYDEWIMIPEDQIDARLARFVREGELEKKIQREVQRSITDGTTVKKGAFGNTFHFTLPNPKDPNEWGAKRFSHEHPFGKLINYNEERHDNALLPEERAKEEAGKKAKEEEAQRLADMNASGVGKWCKRQGRKVKPSRSTVKTQCCWISFLALVAGVICIIYFKVMPSDGMKIKDSQ